MILRWKDGTKLPVEADSLVPETVAGRPADEVARMPLSVGNARAEVGDLFVVDRSNGTGSEETLILEGDLRNLRGIGRRMARGTLTVRGDAGPYLGAGISGGLIEVHGNADDWAGAEMSGGLVRIRGNAGRFVGASFPGSRIGMRAGVILVDGSVGEDAGRRMRRGLIAVGGAAGEGFGRSLIAGSLVAFGAMGRQAGAGMKRGTIALLGTQGVEVFPTFALSGTYRFPFLRIYLRRLAGWGFPVGADVFSAQMARYNGDLAEGGQGEILVWAGAG
jgi:formylmethanofuran dehydrogenase subunit C